MSEIDPRDTPAIEHAHFGAGTFGLGMVVEICHGEAGLKTAVISRDSQREYHRHLKVSGSYTVLFDSDETRPKNLKPKFIYHNTDTEGAVIDLIANPSLALVTTSVRKDNLPTIGALLARGLTKRAEFASREVLCVIACENLVDNSSELKKHVISHLPKDRAKHLLSEVFFCNTLVDRICAPISCRGGTVRIPIESFHLWIVQAPERDLGVLELLRGKGLIILAANEAEFKVHETQKYWCMNGVHLAAAAYAYNYQNNLKHFSQVFANPHIASKIKALQKELEVAFAIYLENIGLRSKFSRRASEQYSVRVFHRLQRNRTDTIARVLKLEAGPDAIHELLDRIERLLKPQCQILARNRGLVRPKDEAIVLHPVIPRDERLELDDALQQVLFALRSFARDYSESAPKAM